MNLERKQRGITLTGMIMGCIVLGGAALLFMKLWPVYNEKFKVDLAMDKLATHPEGARLTKLAASKELMKQFDVNDVDTFSEVELRRTLEVKPKKGSHNKLASLKYEIRAPLFGDLDVVMKYDKTVELGGVKTD